MKRPSTSKVSQENIWTDDVLAVIGQLIQFQDGLIAALGTAIINGIEEGDYNKVEEMLPVIFYGGKMLIQLGIELQNLKPADKVGRPPTWYYLGIETSKFGRKTMRAIKKILREIEFNEWHIINKRLRGCKLACELLQKEIMKALPEKTVQQTFADPKPNEDWQIYTIPQPDPVRAALYIQKTLEMGRTERSAGGGRWRRK